MSENMNPALVDKSGMKIGGQAVIEGVMMRSPHFYAVAVRDAQGQIQLKSTPLYSLAHKYPFLKKFLFRGVLTLVESLILGYKALNYSADLQMEISQEQKKQSRSAWLWMGSFTLALIFGIGIFVVLPYYLTSKIATYGLVFNFVDGIIRLLFFVLYVYGISMMKDIRAIFQYHGGEHKAVYAFEKGEELTVENARKFSPLHPRCGTAFLMVVMVVAIIVFSLIPISTAWPKTVQTLVKIGIRIIFIPFIAGISYEIIKWADKKKNIFTKMLIAPGLWMQKLTTAEPSDAQLEVAIAALQEVIRQENEFAKEKSSK